MDREITQEELVSALREVLRKPFSSVGRRLRSEQSLADGLHMSRWQVRAALADLVANGILVRRRGSGTYVRKTPHGNASPAAGAATVLAIPEHLLFAEAGPAHGRPRALQPASGQRRLELSLWSDWDYTMHPTIQAILAAMTQRVQDTGHRLGLHSLMRREDLPLSKEELSGYLDTHPCDGYLVLNRWIDPFIAALREEHPPVLSFYYSTQPVGHPALVTFDTEEATERAITLLAREGFRRIGLAGYVDPSVPTHMKEAHYRAYMESNGLSHQACVFTEKNPTVFHEEMLALLRRGDRPDALYVAHDQCLSTTTDALRQAGLVPGKDIGLIALSNRKGIHLPQDCEWSCLEFDAEALGRVIIDEMLRLIEVPGALPHALSLHATWRPGTTHLRAAGNALRSGG